MGETGFSWASHDSSLYASKIGRRGGHGCGHVSGPQSQHTGPRPLSWASGKLMHVWFGGLSLNHKLADYNLTASSRYQRAAVQGARGDFAARPDLVEDLLELRILVGRDHTPHARRKLRVLSKTGHQRDGPSRLIGTPLLGR
jgi:hypothetical protein